MPNEISRQREFMRTTITIKVVQTSELKTVEILDAIETAYGEFDRIVKVYTRFNEDSELSNLNRNSGNWVKVNPEFFMLIKQMLEFSEVTNGSFDPTVIDFLETYGYDPNYDFSKLDKPELDDLVHKMAKTRNSWQQIQLNSDTESVRLAKGQRLDLGGIGKGYAIDCAYAKLLHMNNFLIDAGGDIRAKGTNIEGKPWKIDLKHKDTNDQEKILGYLELNDTSIAASGSWARKVKQFHHILDPLTGKPVDSMRTVYVLGPIATITDVWATSLFVGGKDLIAKLPEGYEAMLVTSEDKAIMTEGFRKAISQQL